MPSPSTRIFPSGRSTSLKRGRTVPLSIRLAGSWTCSECGSQSFGNAPTGQSENGEFSRLTRFSGSVLECTRLKRTFTSTSNLRFPEQSCSFFPAGVSETHFPGRNTGVGTAGSQIPGRNTSVGIAGPHFPGRNTGVEIAGSQIPVRNTGAGRPGPHFPGRNTGIEIAGSQIPVRNTGGGIAGPQIPGRNIDLRDPVPQKAVRKIEGGNGSHDPDL